VRLWEALFEAPRDPLLSMWSGSTYERHRWSSTVADAHRVAGALRARGVEPGAAVAMVVANSRDAVVAVLATWLAGARVVSLPDLRRGLRSHAESPRLEQLAAHAEAQLLLVDTPLRGRAQASGGQVDVALFSELEHGRAIDGQPPADSEIAFVQYSSGTTGRPKGCALTSAAIGAQLSMLSERLAPTSADSVMSWLPLSHDMGFFGGLLFPLAVGIDATISSAARFASAPWSWFDDCASRGATMTAAPNVALEIATRLVMRRPLKERLRLRACIVGAEHVGWSTLAAARSAFGPYGLTDTALIPAYGLAEAVLAVSADRPDAPPRRLRVNAAGLFAGEVVEADLADPQGLDLVSLGRPLSGVEVRTSADVGELLVRSPSLATGYLNEAQLTSRRFFGGELATGDRGILRDGEVFIVGREDDVISVHGRNVDARAVEHMLGKNRLIRPGAAACVAVPTPHGQRVVVLAEPASLGLDWRRAATALREGVLRHLGLQVDEWVFLQQAALPMTPSGKLQRFQCRGLVASSTSEVIERVWFAPRAASRTNGTDRDSDHRR
jgi:fatty-acyl-CoA synthase